MENRIASLESENKQLKAALDERNAMLAAVRLEMFALTRQLREASAAVQALESYVGRGSKEESSG